MTASFLYLGADARGYRAGPEGASHLVDFGIA